MAGTFTATLIKHCGTKVPTSSYNDHQLAWHARPGGSSAPLMALIHSRISGKGSVRARQRRQRTTGDAGGKYYLSDMHRADD